MSSNTFQNLPSQKMYEFLMKKMETKELTRQQIADALEVYQGNPSTYFHGLKNGTLSVKVEHILKAQQAFGLDPCALFHDEPQQYTTTNDQSGQESFGSQISQLIDVVKQQQKVVAQQQQTIEDLLKGEITERRKNA